MKLITSIDYISNINSTIFLATTNLDEVLYYKYQQDKPYSLLILIDYSHNELVLEFTGKILKEDYPQLINHNNNSWVSTFNKLSQKHSTSIGIGVILRHPMARFELNFAVPLTCHSDDLLRKGFQFGLGFEFL